MLLMERVISLQRNIGVVLGNASAVTIWGESAGAMAVGLHLIAPGSRGLFHQGIMESNVAGCKCPPA